MRTLNALLAIALSMPLAAATPSRLAPQWQTTPTMWESGTYTYDGAGNIVAIGADQYRYDGASRLVNATANTPSHANVQTFQYDDYGNLLRVETDVTPTGGAHVNTKMVMPVQAGTNQLLENPSATDCPPGVICVSGKYDAAGNQTLSNGYISYEWDALGNLAKLSSGLGRVERYIYDANDERIMTLTVSGSAQRREYTLRDADKNVIRELVDTVTSGTHEWMWTKDYVYHSGGILAAIAPTTAGEAIQHFHVDHLGTPRVITDARGYRLSLHTYLPYGVEATGSERDGERMKFTGHERDFGGGPGEDLDYMHARYYTPVTGRFLGVDPLLGSARRPQSLNRYTYVTNNPLTFMDPLGLVERKHGGRMEPGDTCVGKVMDGYCTEGEVITVKPKLTLLQKAALGTVIIFMDHVNNSAVGNAWRAAETEDLNRGMYANMQFMHEALTMGLMHYDYEGSPTVDTTQVDNAVMVIGKLDATATFTNQQGKVPIRLRDWTIEANDEIMADAIARKYTFQLASAVTKATIFSSQHGLSVFGRELVMLMRAGYVRVGSKLLPSP